MKRGNKVADQVKERDRSNKQTDDPKPTRVISTGSTLLDLAISWESHRGGGIPPGIMVEIFGPSSAGKTTLLCEIAGGVQRAGGQALYLDPEGRLSAEYASRLGFEIDLEDDNQYKRPDTIPEAFEPIRTWEPEPEGAIHGIFADSLAALSTEMEMEASDKMGMRRAKEFSEQLRKSCRTIANENYLLVCSNQIRQTLGGPFQEQYKSPGGESIAFYSSLRLRVSKPTKIKKKKKIGSGVVEKVVATSILVTVYKSSVGEPFNSAPVYIDLNYGIDDIRANLDYLKKIYDTKTYILGDDNLGKGIDAATARLEENNWEKRLRNEVIRTWFQVQDRFRVERKDKVRI